VADRLAQLSCNDSRRVAQLQPEVSDQQRAGCLSILLLPPETRSPLAVSKQSRPCHVLVDRAMEYTTSCGLGGWMIGFSAQRFTC
jgi:hypothetical protein